MNLLVQAEHTEILKKRNYWPEMHEILTLLMRRHINITAVADWGGIF